ncbi:MAG: hypothetical protein NT123_19485 [Proteobacteria bacterium]|nr:hypothetical protein [Pseudomonadota bacterium]
MSSKKNKSRGQGRSTRRGPQVDIASAALLGALASATSNSTARQDPDAGDKNTRHLLPDSAADANLALPRDAAAATLVPPLEDLPGAEAQAAIPGVPGVDSDLIALLTSGVPLSDAGEQLHALADDALGGVAQTQSESDAGTAAADDSGPDLASGDVDFGDKRAAGEAGTSAGDSTHANAADAEGNIQLAQTDSGWNSATDAPPAGATTADGTAPALNPDGTPVDPNAPIDPNALPPTAAGPAAPALAGLGGAGAAGGAAAAAAAVSASSSKEAAPTTDGAVIGDITKTLRIVDPPVKGAKVVYDANHNGKADTGEAVGTTDDQGNVKISYTAVVGGQFIVLGGTDTITGQKYDADSVSMVLKDVPTATNSIISPISTLLAQSSSLTEADIKALLHLPASVDLASFDYYAEMGKGGANAAGAENALKLAQLVNTISNQVTQYLSTDKTIDADERAIVSKSIASALKAASGAVMVNGSFDSGALSDMVSKYAVAVAAEVRSGVTDITATLANLDASVAKGTLDSAVQTIFGHTAGASVAELNSYVQAVSNIAEATYDAYAGFDPAGSHAGLQTLSSLSDALVATGDDLANGGGLTAASGGFLDYFQNVNTIDQLADHLTAAGAGATDPAALFTQIAAGDPAFTGITEYGSAHVVAGTHLDTSYKGLQALGVDIVNPVDAASALFVSLDTGHAGAALTATDVQSMVDAAASHTLPAFSDTLDVTLNVTQSQVSSLVDLLDGKVDGHYDGSHAGADLVAYGIDHIGADATQGGTAALTLSAQEMLAIKDAGLDFSARSDVTNNINDASLTPVQTADLAKWDLSHGVDHVNVELSDAQAAAMGAAALDLPADAMVHLSAAGSHLSTTLNDMANLGVDSVDTTDPQHVIDLKLGITLPGSTTINTDLEALLAHFKPDGTNVHEVFKPADAVTLELGTAVNINDVSAQVLHELKLLGVDTISGADLNADGIPDHKPTG